MRRNQRPDILNLCLLCGSPYFLEDVQYRIKFPDQLSKCDRCKQSKRLMKCLNETCKFLGWICPICDGETTRRREIAEFQKTNTRDPEKISRNPGKYGSYFKCIVPAGLALIAFCYFVLFSLETSEDMNVKLKRSLQKDFPSQRNETWYHFLSVLDKKDPSVKSITFLHGEDKRTPDCLTDKLVSLYSDNKNIKREEITFTSAGYEGMDYGFALEHYRRIVETFRVFITDLTDVSGNLARIFHSLCDEVSSDMKPSLFIFTLKFDERTEKLKPLERANTILKAAWSDLPENEIFPLLSRITKKVVDVVPEKEGSC